MVTTRLSVGFAAACCALLLVVSGGCAKKRTAVGQGLDAPGQDRVASGREALPGEDHGPDHALRETDVLLPPAVVRLGDVFFDFDQALLRPEGRRVLDDAARWLRDHPNRGILVEGHADERGTNEYNLALAERRALAAKRYLVAAGIEAHRIRVISYGEEKPFCTQSLESCWSQNRRGHLVAEN